jgi:hypothetical protein
MDRSLAARRSSQIVKRKRRYSRLLTYSLHAAVLVGLVVAATKYISGKEFLRGVQRFDWSYAPLILALTVAYVLIKGWRFIFQLDQLADVNRWVILRVYLAGQACTLLPGGMAARAGMLEQAGVPVEDSAASIALSSLSDQLR